MAKAKKRDIYEWAFFVIVVLLLLTNVIWFMAVQEVNQRIDGQAGEIELLSAQLNR